MSLDWCPGMREACLHWDSAPMLQQTFQAMEQSFIANNDACIDAAKCMMECVCQIIIDELDNPIQPLKPDAAATPITKWVAIATQVLKLSDVRDNGFKDLIKHHNLLAESLRVLRNDAGPVSHGKNGFIEILSKYHRRSAVLSADAIVMLPALCRQRWMSRAFWC
jgi:Abortive infection C-terminus